MASCEKNGSIFGHGSRRNGMFSIFDYLRRRVCDAFLAGAYDAIEIMETEKMKLPSNNGEPVNTSGTLAPGPAQLSKNGHVPKVLASAPPTPAKPVVEGKAAVSTEKKPEQKPAASTTKPASPPTAPSAPPVTPSAPQTNLFTERDAPLPPRRRGRPRKNPPDGNSK
jgi:hypothetical protein